MCSRHHFIRWNVSFKAYKDWKMIFMQLHWRKSQRLTPSQYLYSTGSFILKMLAARVSDFARLKFSWALIQINWKLWSVQIWTNWKPHLPVFTANGHQPFICLTLKTDTVLSHFIVSKLHVFAVFAPRGMCARSKHRSPTKC